MSIYAVVKEAAKHGRAEVLDWALAHQRWGDSLNSTQHPDTVLLSRSIELVQLDAVASGDLHVLGRLLALEGHLHLESASFKGDPINRISSGCPGWDFVQLCVRSREADQATVTVLELVHSTCLFKLPSTRSEVRDHTCELAAATGSALCLEWLLAHGWRNGPRTSHFAAKICALPVLEALARHGIGFSQLTWRCANRKSWLYCYDGVAIADAERKVRAPLLKPYSPYLLSHYSY